MTRQNQIPCSGGHGLHLALIPFLDMCNHCEGHVRKLSGRKLIYLLCNWRTKVEF